MSGSRAAAQNRSGSRARIVAASILLGLSSAAQLGAGSARDEFQEMMAPILHAPGASAKVRIARSDPFGGPPELESGVVWYVAGRGLRYRSEGTASSDIVLDRAADACIVYRPDENVVYKAPFARAPRRLRRLIEDPDRLLDGNVDAVSERRAVDGRTRAGFRLRPASLGDSIPSLSIWIAPDPSTRLPRWVEFETETDSVRVEFRDWSIRRVPRADDLRARVPPDAQVEPLDPRSLLESGETR